MDSDADSPEKKKSKLNDYDFSPHVDMMVHDLDDERTLDEEEALGESEDPQVELSNLEKERDMPLEALLALYGINNPSGENSTSNCSEEVSENLSTMDDKKEAKESPFEGEEEDDEEEEDKPEPSELQQLYNDIPPENSTPVRSLRLSRPQSEEEEEDCDYSPDEEEWKKTIMVGSDYQAWIPEGLCKYDDALPYENEDKQLWDSLALDDADVESYLVKAQEPLFNNAQGVHAIPMGAHTRDDEQALYLLLQCGYNIEEALRRRRMNVVPPTDTMSLWSEEECRNFENGLRTYGKDFHQIQHHKVRTRSVGELVQFYYLWKKTERHDIFANKARLEKKKYTLHPGITDYMDRFLEEQESGGTGSNAANAGNVQRDRSTSPNIHCLIYGDPKRQQRVSELTKDKLESLITLKTTGSLGSSTSDLLDGTLSFNQAAGILSSDSGISLTHSHASETLAQ